MMVDQENVENIAQQTQMDILDVSLTIPARKLDADQYSVDDLDGVTESLFGSGNMAYGALQASQTDEALIMSDPFSYDDHGNLGIVDTGDSGHARLSAVADNIQGNLVQGLQDIAGDNDDIVANTGSADGQNPFNIPNAGNSDGNFAANTVGSVSASQLSSDAGSFQSSDFGGDGQDGIDADIPDVPSPVHGQNGTNGADGSSGKGKIINVELGDTHIDLGDLFEFIDESITELGDIITTLVTEITNIDDILGDIINNIENFDLSSIITLVTNTTNNLVETVYNTLTEITNITNILDTILEDGDLNLGLDLNVLDTLLTNVNIPLGDITGADFNLDVVLNPASDLMNNIANLTGLDVLSDVLSELGGTTDVLQTTINQITDLVSDLNVNDPGASIDQLMNMLDGLNGTVGDITNSVDVAVGGVLDQIGIGNGDGALGETIDEVVGDVGDLADSLTGGLTNDLTGSLGGALDEMTDNVDALTDDALDDVVGNITDIVGDVSGNLADELTGGTELGGLVEQITGEIGGVNDLLDALGGGGDANDTDSDVTIDMGLGGLNLDIIDDPVDVALDPVEDLIGDIDLGAGLDAGLLGGGGETDNHAGDADITVDTNIDLVDNTILAMADDIPLDPVEDIIGDIDLDIGVAFDALSNHADPVVNDGEGGTGEETLASGIRDDVGDLVDNVISGGDIEDMLSVDTGLETVLEQIEDIAGSDDLNLGSAIDLLNNNDLDSIDGMGSGNEETSWTESIIDESGLFDDLIDGLGGMGDVLPDPVGTVAEGLGVLDVDPGIDVGSLGGLFG